MTFKELNKRIKEIRQRSLRGTYDTDKVAAELLKIENAINDHLNRSGDVDSTVEWDIPRP